MAVLGVLTACYHRMRSRYGTCYVLIDAERFLLSLNYPLMLKLADVEPERTLKMKAKIALRNSLRGLALLIVSTFVLAATAEAATVYNCSSSGRKCVVKVEEGIIGDHVKVLDEKARVVAHGRIVKRKGTYAVVTITRKAKSIRKGYPVIVDIENRSNSNLQWAASFSKQD